MARTDGRCCLTAGAKAVRPRAPAAMRYPSTMDSAFVLTAGALKHTDVTVAGLFSPVLFPADVRRYAIGFCAKRTAPVTFYYGPDAPPDVYGFSLSAANGIVWYDLQTYTNLIPGAWYLSCSGTDVLRVYECYQQ